MPESTIVKCPKPGCGTHYSPLTSSDQCPHKWIGRATPFLDELGAKLRRGETIKFESWNPAPHPHTGEIDAPASV